MRTRRPSLPLLLSVALLLLSTSAPALLAAPLPLVQEVDADEGPGAPFPPGSGVGLLLEEDGRLALVTPAGRRDLSDASSVSFDADAQGARRVLSFDALTGELVVLFPSPASVRAETYRFGELAGLDVGGVALAGNHLFALDATRGRLLRIDGALRGARRRAVEITLPPNLPALAGLARHPLSGHLFTLAPASGELLELTPEGALVAVHQLPARVEDPRAIAIAPSSDQTDDPAQQDLFVTSATTSGATTYELALAPMQLAAATTEVPTLVQTVATSAFNPPSPDPAGAVLLGPDGPLLVCDSEVDEMTIYRGVNLYEVSLAGSLLATSDTTFFTNEPTDVTQNPANGHFFFSDDTGTQTIYEVTPGSDGRVNVGDSVRQIKVSNFGSTDAEGVSFGAGALWLADGVNAEVYRIAPGPNGIFDGGGDDVVSHFDTGSLGMPDIEGIAYDTDSGNLFISASDTSVAELTPSGSVLRWLDISAANARNVGGLAYGPGPAGSTTRRLYVIARGRDNNTDPSENDGKYYVFAVNPLGGGGPTNQPPLVSAGPDLTVDLAAAATLDGTVSDDGLPNGTLSVTWSQVSGPGTTSFANSHATDTTATFSGVGSYVLRLTASDGQLSAFDDVAVSVTSSGSGGTTTVEKRVAASTDDAEQGNTGSVSLTSSDLELVTDGSDIQTVGMRFAGLAIPNGATIQSAWVQFQVDETGSTATTLAIQGEAADDAAPYTSGTNNISARPRTQSSVAWSPPAWNTVGEVAAAERTPDIAPLIREIVSRGGWQSGNALALVITGSGKRTAVAYDGIPAGAPLLHVVFGGAAGNQAPTVSAGPDRTIQLGQTASLDGTVGDDGLPNGTLTTTWSMVSGPGTVGFANASAVDTTATFSAAGSYVLQLTASDGQLSAHDEMAVTVTANAPPSVSAGPDRTVTLGQSAALDGTVSDDGLPNNTLTTTWSKVSGPGTVGFANASAVDTSATFSAAGLYQLRLTASDGQLSAQDDVLVTVIDPNASGVVEQRVGSGSDDAEERVSGGRMSLSGGGDLELAVDGKWSQWVGLRFTNLAIPPGATIQNAWIQFQTDETKSGSVSLTLQGQKSGDAATFSGSSYDVSSRPRTTAKVTWSPPAWTRVGEASTPERTPNLASVIQEVVSQPGWNLGHSLVIVVSGTGTRTAESFEGTATGAALLHVEFGPSN